MKKRDSNLLTRSPGSRPEDDHALRVLSDSDVYRDYGRAFTEATGLTLNFHAPKYAERHPAWGNHESPFYALMAKTNETCSKRYEL